MAVAHSLMIRCVVDENDTAEFALDGMEGYASSISVELDTTTLDGGTVCMSYTDAVALRDWLTLMIPKMKDHVEPGLEASEGSE